VNMNLKTLTVEQLESQKKDMHMASFRYQIQQLERDITGKAEDAFTPYGWSDVNPPLWQSSVLCTIRRFKDECEGVFGEQEGCDSRRYLETDEKDEGFYMRTVAEMMKSLSSFVLKGKVMRRTIGIAAPWGAAPGEADGASLQVGARGRGRAPRASVVPTLPAFLLSVCLLYSVCLLCLCACPPLSSLCPHRRVSVCLLLGDSAAW
jgi:hypothetical protein